MTNRTTSVTFRGQEVRTPALRVLIVLLCLAFVPVAILLAILLCLAHLPLRALGFAGTVGLEDRSNGSLHVLVTHKGSLRRI